MIMHACFVKNITIWSALSCKVKVESWLKRDSVHKNEEEKREDHMSQWDHHHTQNKNF